VLVEGSEVYSGGDGVGGNCANGGDGVGGNWASGVGGEGGVWGTYGGSSGRGGGLRGWGLKGDAGGTVTHESIGLVELPSSSTAYAGGAFTHIVPFTSEHPHHDSHRRPTSGAEMYVAREKLSKKRMPLFWDP